MKKNTYIFGIICLIIIMVASIFKIFHWPGAGIMLVAGLGSISLIFLPIAYVALRKSTDDKLLKFLYLAALISFSIDFIGALFKIMHWPGAGLVLIIGIPLPFILFLPVYIIYHNKRKLKTDMNFFAILLFMIYLGVFSSLLALDPNGGTYMAYAHCTNEVSKANNYLAIASSDKDTSEISTSAKKLAKQIEDFKMKLVQTTAGNKRIIQPDGQIDYFEIGNKGIGISPELLTKSGFNELNQEIEKFDKMIKLQNTENNFLRLMNEINDYRVPKYKDADPIIFQLPLISMLNVLNDWKNKMLLISYIKSQKSI